MEGAVCCERCATPMRLEGAHYRCLGCGFLTHCCEGNQELFLPPPIEEEGAPKTRRSEGNEATKKKS